MTDNFVPLEPKCSTSFAIESGNLTNERVCGNAEYLIEVISQMRHLLCLLE